MGGVSCTDGGEKQGGVSAAPTEPTVAPTPGASGRGSSAGVLTGCTSPGAGARVFNVRYAAATDQPSATIAPDDGSMGRDAGALSGGITLDAGARREGWGGVVRGVFYGS